MSRHERCAAAGNDGGDMKDERETREKLLCSAKKEFSEKGFMKASLRNICKNTGVTTGALYFFFKDKDDLFVSLVREPLARIHKIMSAHFTQERQMADEGAFLTQDFSDDYEASFEVIHELYLYREEFLLLITKAQGSSLENAVDAIVEISDRHYHTLAGAYADRFPGMRMEEETIHWIAHMQTDIFVYMITHIETEDEAVRYMKQAVRYMVMGWYGMFGIVPNLPEIAGEPEKKA